MAIQVLKWRPRGPVYFAERDETATPATPKAFGQAHCVDQITLALNIDYLTHDAKCSRVDAEDARDIKKVSGEATIDFSNYTPEAIALALAATENAADVAPDTVTSESLPTVAEGDSVILGGAYPKFNIAATGFSIVDSTGSPQTLDEGTDYTIDAKFGLVTFGDLTGFVQPLKASYTYQNPKIFAALAAGRVVRWIRFNGTNYPDNDSIVPVDLFKCQFSPTTSFDLLPDDYGKLQLKVSVQIDLTRESSDALGQFLSMGQG